MYSLLLSQVWFLEFFGGFPWEHVPDTEWQYPAIWRWVPEARYKKNTKVRTSIQFLEAIKIITTSTPETVQFFPWGPNRYSPDFYGGGHYRTPQRWVMRGMSSDVYYLGERVTRQHGTGTPATIPKEPPVDMLYLAEHSQTWLDGRAGLPFEMFVVEGDYETWVRARLRTPQVLRSEGLSVLPLPGMKVSYRQGSQRMTVDIPVPERVPRAFRPPPDAKV
jgi:hypothetical protein